MQSSDCKKTTMMVMEIVIYVDQTTAAAVSTQNI